MQNAMVDLLKPQPPLGTCERINSWCDLGLSTENVKHSAVLAWDSALPGTVCVSVTRVSALKGGLYFELKITSGGRRIVNLY